MGGIHDKVAAPVAFSLTVMEKLGSAAVKCPSDTDITIPSYVPTSALLGVPVIRPVLESMIAQDGRLVAENVSTSLSGSVAAGSNEYA